MTEPLATPERVKCLLVDDLDANLVALAALLRSDDLELLQATSARQALELLLVHDVAVALVDVQMPEMDGFELAELMRGSERTRRVPIIFVTAGARDQNRLFKGYETGAVDFLFKPVEPHILKSKVAVFVQLYRQSRQLAVQLKERTETLRLNEIFTAVLGHDLRSPLSVVLMNAKLLSNHADESVQRIGTRLLRSGHWMSRMIEDTLDLSRSRLGGGIAIKRARIDLGALTERVVEERQSTAGGRAIGLTLQGDLVGEWDADRLTQVASNLIGNALTHGDPALPIEVAVDGTRPHEVVWHVTSGGSIPAELLPHIFDPFRSGRPDSTRTEGLGLGLYIVWQIVNTHGGRVEVRSEPGAPTCFKVVLPRV